MCKPVRNTEANKERTCQEKTIKKEYKPNDHLLVLFDVKPLFTNVPRDETIEIMLNKIFGKTRF